MKFTNRGGKVQVRLERVNSHVEVVVSDTGIGIAPEFLPHVFERFRQADAGITRERGGLGLGLSIARQLTEMHGGTIEASSGGAGQGATFRLKLPLMILHPAATSTTSASQPRTRAAAVGDPRGRSARRPRARRRRRARCAVAGVGGARSGRGARVTHACSRRRRRWPSSIPKCPDVLVADLGMPHVDGYQLIDRVRRHHNPRVRELPAAALTAYARSDDRMKALRAGFHIHLAKPIDPAELVTTIAALANRFMVRRGDR